jgi:hypothetical protein
VIEPQFYVQGSFSEGLAKAGPILYADRNPEFIIQKNAALYLGSSYKWEGSGANATINAERIVSNQALLSECEQALGRGKPYDSPDILPDNWKAYRWENVMYKIGRNNLLNAAPLVLFFDDKNKMRAVGAINPDKK